MFVRKESPSPTLSDRSAKDGRHCDLCGSPSPAVRCDKCGGHCFCLSCDDMYHRHPKRKSHQRKAADSVVPGSGPGVSRRAAAAPGDPSKMPIPPPRKKKGKSIFASLTGSSGNEVPALPKKEFSLTEKLGSIRRFMSNRPLPPIPKENERPTSPRGNQVPRMPAAFNTQPVSDRQTQSKSKTPSEDGFPNNRANSPQYQNILSHLTKLAQSSCEEWEEEPSTSGSARGSSGGEEGWGQETRGHRHAPNPPPPLYPRGRGQEESQWTGMGTLRRGQTAPYMHPGSGFGGPGLSTSATDLTTLGLQPQGGPVPGFPYMYPPGVPPLYPHFAPAQSMGRLNFPYYGGSWSNIRKKAGTDADEDADDDDEVDDETKRSTLTRRRHSESKMKRSQSVMYDPSLVPGAYFPFGGMPPPGYPGYMGPGYPYWAQPDSTPGIGLAPPSPSAAHRTLTRGQGRSRRRQQDEDSSASSYTGSNPRGNHPRSRRKQDHADGDISSEEDDKEVNARVNMKSNPSSKSNPGGKTSSGVSSPKGGEKSDASAGSNPGKNPEHNPGGNPGHNPEINPGDNPGSNPNPAGAPTSTWECEFCTFINSPGSRICSICCKSIPVPHHDSQAPPGEAMEEKKDINLTELSEEVIKEQERIEKEIRRQIEVKLKLNEESPGVQASQTSSTSMTEESEQKTTEKQPSPVLSPPTSPVPPLSTERLSPKITVDVEQSTVSATPLTGVEIQTQTEVSDKTVEQTDATKNIQTETSNVSVQSESVSTQIEEPKPLSQFPKILTPSKLDSSCQTNGDLQGLQNDLSVRPKLSQSVAHQTEDISRARDVPSPRGLHVEMGTSPPPQDFFAPPPIIIAEPDPYERRERFGLLQRSLSQTSLNEDREFRRKTREEEQPFGQLVRSLSRGSLASEPGTGGFNGGQHGRFSRNQPTAFAPVGSGPRNLYTSDWNLHRRTDWDEDPNRTGRHSTLSANLNRRKSAGHYLEELAERRRQEQMRSQGLEMVRIVRKAEQAGFVPDDLEVALANCGDQDPVDWLEENWRNMIETVATLATNYGHDKPENDVGIVSAGEARAALRIQRGNIWAAVTECVETRQRKCLDIQSRGEFSRREVIAALTAQEGSSELAYDQLIQSRYPEKEKEHETLEPEQRYLQTGNSTFFDARMPSRDQPDRKHLNIRPDIRRSSLVDSFAPEQQPGRTVSRRFSYSAGITQGLPSPNDYFSTQRAADISDAQSFTSEDFEAAAAVIENIPEQERERDRLNCIKSRRAAQKDVKRSASFLDKLASLRKDKQQAERKPNESRFLRYGSLNVLTVDTSGLRQSSFEEAMSTDLDPRTDVQPQKKGFLSRLLHRSSSTDETFPKSEFFVGREGQPQMVNFPVARTAQEYPVTADRQNVGHLLAEPSAIEKVQAYLNQIQGNQSSPHAPDSFPQTAGFSPAVSPQNVFTAQQQKIPTAQPQILPDANQIQLMLQKLGLMPQPPTTQANTHSATEMRTSPIQPTDGTTFPVSSTNVVPHFDVLPQGSESQPFGDSPIQIAPDIPQHPERDIVSDAQQKERTKLNTNTLKAQWLGVDLSSPDSSVKVEDIYSPTMASGGQGTISTVIPTIPMTLDNRKTISPVKDPININLIDTTEQIKTVSQDARPITPIPGQISEYTIENDSKPGTSALDTTQADIRALKTYLQESLKDVQTEMLADDTQPERKGTLDDSFKEIREFYVGPSVIKKGTSLELDPEDEDSYLDGTVDDASSKDFEQFTHDSGFESKKLSVTQSSTLDLSSDISDSVPETDADIESAGYTDVEIPSPEHIIEEYVQAIVFDNFKPPPPVQLPTPEKPPEVAQAEPDYLDIPQSPVRRRRRSASRDKLSKQAQPQQVSTEKSDLLKAPTIAPQTDSTKTVTKSSKIALNALEPVEHETPIIPNATSPVENIPNSDARLSTNDNVSATLSKVEIPQTVSQERPATLQVHRPEVPEVLTKTPEVITSVQDTKPATAVSSARVRRQRSISRDRRNTLNKEPSELTPKESITKDRRVTLSREASESTPKESTTIRRKGSVKQDSSVGVAKTDAVETGRKSLKDTKKAIGSESKLDRYRKSARSPEKQGKADAQSTQTGAVMSAKRLALDTRIKELLAKDKCGSYEQAEMAARLMEMNFGEAEALQAAKECGSLYQAISFLQQDCELCAGKFPVAQMVSMIHCTHRACRECLKAYFSIQIRDRNILELLCPFCSEPDLTDDDVASDYFNHMDLMLKNLVEPEIHELFHRKLRDRALMKDPNFRWCSQCSSGFIINNPNQRRLLCPDCKAVTCASCRKLWEKQHEGISCQQFQEWKEANDPELQAAGLAQHLAENGIDCPNCHFRYSLAKGGCMHFRCIQCQYDFCSGCSKPFKMGQKCGVSDFCAKLGLHAHHPRNCLFYLRDKEPEDLQKLLDELAIPYNKSPPTGSEVKVVCQVNEQKETPEGLRDDICGKEVLEGYGGLCRIHYTEFLVALINRYRVDPLPILDVHDLQCVLRRGLRDVPETETEEAEEMYRKRLVEVIQDQMPLEKIEGS